MLPAFTKQITGCKDYLSLGTLAKKFMTELATAVNETKYVQKLIQDESYYVDPANTQGVCAEVFDYVCQNEFAKNSNKNERL